MVGYAVSIMACITASTLCLTGGIYDLDENQNDRLKPILYLYPTFPFCRINYLLSEACSWYQCISNWRYVPDEIHEELKALYTTAVVYMILALYLNQIVPQEFGVAKHPLFFLEGTIKRLNPQWHKEIFHDDDRELQDFDDNDKELRDEDNDVRAER